ncbi:hypothetical protein [Cloacibacillus porcorum]|uniref:Uncharacterized protein n=1 Tax=Cloacibacillus porcorum TaxID=1197717 RepID=A0A1B2I438_9BACT|nr:hypothetical protein [Cloacibacillus porcorum]ANZ44729.1 hypothetical protein BED41_06270 [Cloacibacillus porcorum]MCI5864549.1 hypothetical protein [Cloacibacillus porcorum]
MKKLTTLLIILGLLFGNLSTLTAPSFADTFDQVLQRWTKSRKIVDEDGANLEVRATYYSAEFIEALVQKEAKDNLWTQQEADDYKYKFLSSLKLDELIPIQIEFINNGPTMFLGPFDIMVKLRIAGKTYKPVDYDRRFNFKFQGKKEGLVFFPRFDEKTGKDLLKGVKNVSIEFVPAISPILEGRNISFIWDIARDDPQALYKGAAANKLETDRLLKRLEKLRKDKAEEEAKLKAINDEISTIQNRLDELARQ